MTKTIKIPINVHEMMKKYKDANMDFKSFLNNLELDADIFGWLNFEKYEQQEETLMRAWLDFENVEKEAIYHIKLPYLVTTDGEAQYISCKDGKYFASRENPLLQQHFVYGNFPVSYYGFSRVGKIGSDI